MAKTPTRNGNNKNRQINQCIGKKPKFIKTDKVTQEQKDEQRKTKQENTNKINKVIQGKSFCNLMLSPVWFHLKLTKQLKAFLLMIPMTRSHRGWMWFSSRSILPIRLINAMFISVMLGFIGNRLLNTFIALRTYNYY